MCVYGCRRRIRWMSPTHSLADALGVFVRLEHASPMQRDVASLRFARRRVDSVGGGRDSTSSIATAAVVVAYEY